MPRPSSPRTRASSSGERSCTTKVMARRAAGPATAPLPHGQHPGQQLPDAPPRSALQGHPPDRLPGSLGGAHRERGTRVMMGVRTPSGAPAPVAPLPSRELPRSVHFSMARSVHFSVAIHTDRAGCVAVHRPAPPGHRATGSCPRPALPSSTAGASFRHRSPGGALPASGVRARHRGPVPVGHRTGHAFSGSFRVRQQ